MSKQLKISAIIPIAIVMIAVIAMMGLTTADSSKYPYGGNMPPWVDQHSIINTIPTAIATSSLWSAPVKNPYNGNLPPWVEYNVTVPDPIILTINGNVNYPQSMTMSELRAIGVKHVNMTLNAHGSISYVDADAISLSALIQKASPKSGATAVKFIGSDGYTPKTPVTLANITADKAGVLAFTSDTGLRDCMPSQPSSAWVKDIVTITVV